MKSWTYKTITEKAEAQIKRFMAGGQPWDEEWAFGAFMLWKNITLGWQDEGDSERLEALTRREQKAQPDSLPAG